MQRAISARQLSETKFKEVAQEGEWARSFGDKVEISGSWIIVGDSGHGKTRYSLMLAKYLTQFGSVAYNTLEEGARSSFKRAVTEVNFQEVTKGRFKVLNREPMEALKERLRKRKSPDIIFVDSFQYTGLGKVEYIALKEEFPNKLFIWISHAEGKKPAGRPAQFVRYDSDIVVFVKHFKAIIQKTRYQNGGEPFVIWEEGAEKKWGDLN